MYMAKAHCVQGTGQKRNRYITQQSASVTSFDTNKMQQNRKQNKTKHAQYCGDNVLRPTEQIRGHKSGRHVGTPSAQLCVLAITCLQPCVCLCVGQLRMFGRISLGKKLFQEKRNSQSLNHFT